MAFKKIFFVILGLAALYLAQALFYFPSFPDISIQLPNHFEEEIQKSEAALKPTPGTEKRIIWQTPDKSKTKIGLTYIHGFSATNKEISPVPEMLSKDLNANLFLTRLTGHGLGTEGMREVTPEKLFKDAEEAFQITEKIGEKPVILGFSTGADLALYLANKYKDKIAALILFSPNFRPAPWNSVLARGPLGHLTTKLVIGDYYEFKTHSEEEKTYWTSRYPSSAVSEMMNMLAATNRINLSEIKVPTVVLYTELDQVVSVDLIKENYNKIGSNNKKLISIPSQNHVLAGSVMSPDTTEFVEKTIKEFVSQSVN
jgi:esterase/lipase